MGRAYRQTAAERARLAAEQRSSGKTQMAWCEDHGISTKTFRRWVLGAKEGEGDSNCAADWVELNGCNSKPSLSPVSNGVIEILAGAYTTREARFQP
jgi:transposase-like protein